MIVHQSRTRWWSLLDGWSTGCSHAARACRSRQGARRTAAGDRQVRPPGACRAARVPPRPTAARWCPPPPRTVLSGRSASRRSAVVPPTSTPTSHQRVVYLIIMYTVYNNNSNKEFHKYPMTTCKLAKMSRLITSSCYRHLSKLKMNCT